LKSHFQHQDFLNARLYEANSAEAIPIKIGIGKDAIEIHREGETERQLLLADTDISIGGGGDRVTFKIRQTDETIVAGIDTLKKMDPAFARLANKQINKSKALSAIGVGTRWTAVSIIFLIILLFTLAPSLIKSFNATGDHKQAQTVDSKDVKENASTIADPDQRHYMEAVEHQLKMAWHAPENSESKHASVRFNIGQDLRASDSHIFKSSGSKAFDNAALQAVKDSGKFPQLPDSIDPPVTIEFTFDYNVISE